MRKALPEKMFSDPEQSRFVTLRAWVLDNEVTEIEMSERQFWNFALLQPIAEKVLAGERLTAKHSPPQIGRDGKWQYNLYDPDGIRIELMEFQPSMKPCCSPFLLPSPTE